MKVLNVQFSDVTWNPGPTALTNVIMAGACGFYNITKANVRSCDLIRIWSLPGTNPFEKTIVYTAPITGSRNTKWDGRIRTVITFDTQESDWDSSESREKPAHNRNGWVITEETEDC